MARAREVLILKHVAHEGGGTIVEYLHKRGRPYRLVELYAGEPLPRSLDALAAVCVMGGPMNVDEEDKHPFLKEENRFIQELLRRQIPLLGVCLGAQLIAKALGARVYKALRPEIGWMPVRLTAAAQTDPLFSAVPYPDFDVLQWHEDTFDLPADAVLLASSPAAPHQAYRVGAQAWGLQFHVEVTRDMLEDWFKDRADLAAILETHRAYRPALERITERMYGALFG